MALNPYSAYNDPIFIDIHKDPNTGMPVSVEIKNEYQKVFRGYVILNEIPDQYHKIDIEGMFEVDDFISNDKQFKVDYQYGILTFHPNIVDGASIVIRKYYGRGMFLIPDSRIYTKLSDDGSSVVETMEDFINSITEYRYQGLYSNTQKYNVNNIVFYDGSTYIALQDNLGTPPTNTSYWRCMAKGFSFKGEYSPTERYLESDIITTNDGAKMYISLLPNINIPVTNTSTWKPMLNVESWNVLIKSFLDNGEERLSELEKDYNDSKVIWNEQMNKVISDSNKAVDDNNNRMTAIESDYRYKITQWNTDISNSITSVSNKIYDAENRVSLIEVNYNTVIKPNAIQATNNANDKATLAQQSVDNVVAIIDDYNNKIGYSISIRKPPVETYVDLATTYPNPQNGWTVKTLDNGRTYRYDGIDLLSWVYIDSSTTDVEIYNIRTDMGSLSDLTTDDKNTLVGAINEVDKNSDVANLKIGNLQLLSTVNKQDLVKSINETKSEIGNLSLLQTTDKSSVVNGINEVISMTNIKIGTLEYLQTDDKSNIVNAINEINNSLIITIDCGTF